MVFVSSQMGAASWRVPHGLCYTSAAPAPTGLAEEGARAPLDLAHFSSSIEHQCMLESGTDTIRTIVIGLVAISDRVNMGRKLGDLR